MNTAFSLRIRLTLIILIPLLLICVLVAVWAASDAKSRASDRFDRSLLSIALAISRDVAVSGGDALSPETNALLRSTSGGPVFYHVYAPDGVFVTGYATPPVTSERRESGTNQFYFDGRHQSRDVRALRFTDAMQIDGLTGDFTFTVWQDTSLRNAIVRDLSWRTFTVMASILVAVALIVWFGVRLGLRPLVSLEDAISRRSPDDLTPIRRAVPVEASGIVAKLNGLLSQVTSTMKTKDDFISDAAHQLRNPIAGILAMSGAVKSASTLEDAHQRSEDLGVAAKRASDLANNLLTYERARAERVEPFTAQSIYELLDALDAEMQTACQAAGVTLETRAPLGSTAVFDPTMLKEALLNLIDNALLHGGPQLSEITLAATQSDGVTTFCVTDNGVGIADNLHSVAVERFKQVKPADGSGLGLAIAKAVAEQHGGRLSLQSLNPGLCVALVI
ncbi:MAG: sensor histidine kinase [Silicimonas sp.]|nr:sensor histidine kinase [Silicimonas sp.]